MNTKLWICIAFTVLIAHLAVLGIVSNWRRMHEPPAPPPPEPTFTTTTYHYQDERGREVKTEREVRVTTRLATPEELKDLPPPPQTEAGPRIP